MLKLDALVEASILEKCKTDATVLLLQKMMKNVVAVAHTGGPGDTALNQSTIWT
jgi:hypothetical protein